MCKRNCLSVETTQCTMEVSAVAVSLVCEITHSSQCDGLQEYFIARTLPACGVIYIKPPNGHLTMNFVVDRHVIKQRRKRE